MITLRTAGLLLFVSFLFNGCFGIGCGSSNSSSSDNAEPTEQASSSSSSSASSESESNNPPENLGDAINQATQQIQEAFGNEGADGEVEVTDFRRLRDLMPGQLGDMTQTNSSGERTGAFGIKLSQATGEYEGDNKEMTMTLIDMGTLSGAAMLGYAWLNADFDRESDEGFERTMQFEGYPAFQKFTYDGQRFEMHVVVRNRIVVQVEGSGCPMEDVEASIRELGIDNVEDLVPPAV